MKRFYWFSAFAKQNINVDEFDSSNPEHVENLKNQLLHLKEEEFFSFNFMIVFFFLKFQFIYIFD
jgi:hypothetical protein